MNEPAATPVIPPFVHLRLHTEFSVTDGIVRVGDAVRAAASDGMGALAISDLSNLFGLIKFYKAARGKGIKPIAAVDAWFHNESQPDQPFRSLLIVRNHVGYLQVCELLSRAFLTNQIRGRACIRWEWLSAVGCDGLTALCGFSQGEVGQLLMAGQAAKAAVVANRWQQQFGGHFFLELQRRGIPQEEILVQAACRLSQQLGIPVVATHPIQFLKPEDFRAHEARVCIAEGEVLSNPRRPKLFTEQQYFLTRAQMGERFADIPSALANTVRIAQSCNLTLELGKPKLPDFPTPPGVTLDDYMVQLAKEGLEKRLQHLFPNETERERKRPEYEARLKIETDTIIKMGFSGYFLIVQDFINWGKNNGVPVGPGRGSGAGSIAAYALGITDLDPIRYDLLFERFLNPERVSMPDFDIDFCQDNRDRVIEYVKEAYGREAVSQIATFGTLGAKAVIRDAGRVLDMPYNYCDGLSKLIPHVPTDPWDLKRAIEEEPAFKERVENEEEAQAIIKLAQPLEGLTRNIGMHAGGVLIAPGKLTDFCPLYCADGSENSVVSQFDKDDVEAVGLVKFDFLGLRNLTILDWAVRWVREGYDDMRQFRLEDLPLDDPAVYRLFSEGNTTAVFQSESRSAKDLEKKLKPDNFEDIIALMALNRPGPLGSGMVDDFIARKKEQTKTGQGRAEWYFHEKLTNTLKSTYGVIVYQEQVMLVAQLLAGYSLGGADLLRRAMGKKKPEEMAKQREIFTTGATERGVSPQLATQLFDLMEKFAEYGFNKCVHGQTRLVDADTGHVFTVEELFKSKRRPRLHALDDGYRLVPRRVLDVVWNGVKPVFRLQTKRGDSIVATGNHPFRTVDGWANLEDLSIGQSVALARRLRVNANGTWPTHALVTLAGLLGEGATCQSSNLFFCSSDRRLVDDFAEAACGFDNTAARVSTDNDGQHAVCLVPAARSPQHSPGYASNRFSGARLWAESLGLVEFAATDKRVPSAVFELVDSDIALFLGRMWSHAGRLLPQHATAAYVTASKRLAEDIRLLLTRLGIATVLRHQGLRYQDQIRTGYTVELADFDSLHRFVALVLPHVIGHAGSVAILRQSAVPNVDCRARDIASGGLRLQEQDTFSHSPVLQSADAVHAASLFGAGNTDVVWDEVVSIERVGEADTYDLEIEEHHNFVADGFVVHNSHSAAYALVAYHTAWLKAHYPAEFMAATLSSDMDDTDKVKIFVDDSVQSCNLQVLPPDINTSGYRFLPQRADGEKRARIIRYGLGAVKGTGQAACEAIVAERNRNGAYTSLFDMVSRVDRRQINRRVVEALVRGGAFDSLHDNRAAVLASVGRALEWADVKESNASQGSLFDADEGGAAPPPLVDMPPWTDRQKLAEEKVALGYYLTGHLFDADAPKVRPFIKTQLGKLSPGRDLVWMTGICVAVRTMITKRGKMAFLLLDDATGAVEISVFNELYEQCRSWLKEDALVLLQGKVSEDAYSGGLRVVADRICTLAEARSEFVQGLRLVMNGQSDADKLTELLKPHVASEKSCPVEIDYHNSVAACTLRLPDAWRVRPDDALMEKLQAWLGENNATWMY